MSSSRSSSGRRASASGSDASCPGAQSGLKEPLGIVQAALVGLVALLLAFGLTMAVGRYQARRDAVVLEANAIGTTYSARPDAR